MKQYPVDFWNENYSKEEFIYGTQPNQFFKEQLDKLKAESLLLPAEGEGRNAVYAASLGWQVTAFDISERGQEKAFQLAKEKNVSINYHISSVLDFKPNQQFDVIGLSYAHFPIEIRKQAHTHLLDYLNPGGIVIFEAFSKTQLGNTSGGPKSEKMLFSIEEIKEEFQPLKFEILNEETIQLSEGNYHKGEAEVIRFVGVKF